MELFTDEYYMKMALQQAREAYAKDEVPIGAVIASGKTTLAKAYNLTETLTDVTAHAEMQAITQAQHFLGAKYLTDCTLYVTVEPCTMCAGAIYWARFARVVFGAHEPKFGFRSKNIQLHPKTEIIEGVLEAECTELIQSFFRKKRN